jgi:spore maturation protein CgeB
MKNYYLMNSPELPTPGTHHYTTSKFSNGFKKHGYNVIEATTLHAITDDSIVLLSDHGISYNKQLAFKSLQYLADKCPNSIFICWFYHKYYNEIPFKKFVITGEHFHKKPAQEQHMFCWDLQNKINNYVPLTFSSSLYPEDIGTFARNERIDGCFIGTAYKPYWVNKLNNIAYITGNQLPEQQRIDIFLSSKIAFGFHADANVENNVVVERVFEGMAFGCVVISDNPVAAEITDNIVQIARTKEEFLKIYDDLLNDDNKRSELQQRGYEWVKNKGLYFHTAKNFLDKFKELGYITNE